MKDNTGISGEYCFEIIFQNMFTNLHIQTQKYKNIITSNGAKFILTRLYDDNSHFYSIAHGTGTTKASKEDITLEEQTYENLDISYERTETTLHLKTEGQGYNINNTTEIGVYYITPQENYLVSRNVHNPITIPDSAFIITNYYYVLTTAEYLPTWTLVTGETNTYMTELEYHPNYVVEMDTNNGYHLLSDLTDIDSTPGSYYYDDEEGILYIHCTDSESPTTHQMLINY